jgi:sugar phosphate isomerase/epimerase
MPTEERLQGSWMDFQHQNPHDGDYWNETTRQFTAEQWRGKVSEMAALGLKYIVIMSSALDDMAFYPSGFMPRHELACEDPIAAVLEAAHTNNVDVFVSAGFYGHTTEETSEAGDYLEWHRKLAAELYARYGAAPAFLGWYVPNEAEINGHYSAGFMSFMADFVPYLKSLDPTKRVLIAPYGTRKVVEDDAFAAQLRALGAAGVDFIAYQDEVGVRKTQVDELDAIYARLRRLHDRAAEGGQAAPALWADTEIFEFEGATYASALIPASLDRIRRQLAAIAPYVDVMLCYQTHGLLNPPDSPQFCGHPNTVRLWKEYTERVLGVGR